MFQLLLKEASMKSVKGMLAAAAILMAGVMTTTSASGLERWLRIHNEGSQPLCEVYISHVDTDDWGPDLIRSCINPGRYRTVDPGWQQGYCQMDMLFVYDDGWEVEEYYYNICEGADFYVFDD